MERDMLGTVKTKGKHPLQKFKNGQQPTLCALYLGMISSSLNHDQNIEQFLEDCVLEGQPPRRTRNFYVRPCIRPYRVLVGAMSVSDVHT